MSRRSALTYDEVERLIDERDSLRAENKRLRAVLDAAREWRTRPNDAGAEYALQDALDAYEEENDE